MLNNYIIDFTDKKTPHSFQILPYTVNGPTDPTSLTLHDTATSAATSLRLPGKSTKIYGELIAENLVHLMENFAGSIPPQYPIAGQLWFDKNKTPSQLRVFNTKKYQVSHNTILFPGILEITPNNDADKDELLTLLVQDSKIRIFNNDDSGQQTEFLLIADSVYNIVGNTISIYIQPQSTIFNGWFLGGWEYILQNNAKLYDNFNINGYYLTNVPDPILDTHAANKQYVDNAVSQTVTITFDINNPVLGQLLTFNGNDWINVNPNDSLLNLVTSDGDVYITGNVYSNSLQLATVDYVDSLALGGGGASQLSQLTDVTINLPITTDSILSFNGSQWVNTELSIYENKSVIDSITDTLVTVDVDGKLSETVKGTYTPPAIFDTATYETSEVLATHEFVYDFVENSAELLNLNTGDIDVILNEPPLLDNTVPALFFEKALYAHDSYPIVPLNSALGKLSSVLGELSEPKQRTLFKYNDMFTNPHIITLSTSDYGKLDMQYVVDDGSLNVFVNGIKKFISTHGWTTVELKLNNAGTYPIYEGTPTNLNSATTYGFGINVNGFGQVIGSVYGQDAQTYGELIDQINLIADYNTWGFPSGYIPQPPYDIPPTPPMVQEMQLRDAGNALQNTIAGATIWSNVANSENLSDNTFTSVILDELANAPANSTYRLVLKDYNFNIPSTAVISGIEVQIIGYGTIDLDGTCVLWDGTTAIPADNGNTIASKTFTLPEIPTIDFFINQGVSGTNIFHIDGDNTQFFPVTSTFTVQGTTSNDGTYTVVSSTYNIGTDMTEIETIESIIDQLQEGTITTLQLNNILTIGGQTDNWNDADLTNLIINDNDFGLSIIITNNTTTDSVGAFIDSVNIIIYYERPDFNRYSFGAVLSNHRLKFVSGIPGDTSTVEVYNIGGGYPALFSELTTTPVGVNVIETIDTTNTIYLYGDMTNFIAIADALLLINSTNNNGTYTVSDINFIPSMNKTEVIVNETLISSINDGVISLPLSFEMNQFRTSPQLNDQVLGSAFIIGLSTASKTIEVFSDITPYVNSGDSITIENSLNNNGTYTVDTIVYNYIDIKTVIVVLENIDDTVVDGSIPYIIPAEIINPNHAPQPLTAHINEIGRPGRLSTTFEFVTGHEPVLNDLVEITIEPRGFYDLL